MFADVNVSFGNWPFQKFSEGYPSLPKLAHHLETERISSALVSSLDAVLSPDPDIWNEFLRQRIEPYKFMLPVPVLRPTLANWKKTLTEYAKIYPVKSVKVFPNFHMFSLSSHATEECLEELRKKKMTLIIQMRLEDERSQYPLMRVPGANYKEIIQSANKFPELPILCLCSYCSEAIPLVTETNNVYIDISFAEQLNTIASLLKKIPVERILLGSHTPFLYTRAVTMKLEYAEISKKEKELIGFANAQQLFSIK